MKIEREYKLQYHKSSLIGFPRFRNALNFAVICLRDSAFHGLDPTASWIVDPQERDIITYSAVITACEKASESVAGLLGDWLWQKGVIYFRSQYLYTVFAHVESIKARTANGF